MVAQVVASKLGACLEEKIFIEMGKNLVCDLLKLQESYI
jgi:hypothetical protein